MCLENFKCVALAFPEIIVIGVLVAGCERKSRGREGRWGRGWYHLKQRW